jgi:D-alanyl-D-alanine dipeptidase
MHATATCHRSCTANACTANVRAWCMPLVLALGMVLGAPGAKATASETDDGPLSPSTAKQNSRAEDEAPCRDRSTFPTSLDHLHRELQRQGLALDTRCFRGGAVWVVQVRVVDGVKASAVVRGPLADGHDVDMGTPAGVPLAGAAVGSPGFSPDVQHNRQWLSALMARHRWVNEPDAWWHFSALKVLQPPPAEAAIAAR